MLIILGGLPGTGKSTIAQLVVRQIRATVLRIDVIEQAMRDALDLSDDVRDSGYRVAYALAEANLGLGLTVVADSVNPIGSTREGWRAVARRAAVPALEVEVVCSDVVDHRRRVESRSAGIRGLRLPSWEEVIGRAYEPWPTADHVIDTSKMSPDEAAAAIVSAVIGNTSL